MADRLTVPRSIPESRYLVIKVLGAGKKWLSMDEILGAVPEYRPGDLRKNIHSLNYHNYIDCKTTTRGKTYSNNEYGKMILSNLAEITVKAPSGGVAKPDVIPQAQPLNISSAAERLADNTASLIHENEQYRNLLLQIHTLITRSLELDKEES